jgi:hypothetical protein
MYSKEPNPERDMVTKLQRDGIVRAPVVEVVMMGGPLNGRHYFIDVNGTDMEILDPLDAHNAVREGRAPKLLGLYMRFGRSMIWQRRYDDVFNGVPSVSSQKHDEETRRRLPVR